MATTRIMPLHCGKGRTVGRAISDILDYVKNPEKTDHGNLITSYQCNSRIADPSHRRNWKNPFFGVWMAHGSILPWKPCRRYSADG